MKSSGNLGRRAFFARAGVLASVAGALETLQAAQRPGARPKNIIWMVADGMSPSVLPMAENFSKIVRGKGLLWRALIDRRDGARGLMDMASLNSSVTDSSAASSSWGSGSRIFNGMVNVLPDGTKLTPIAAIARDKGKRIGLVTTATVTHATPAGFAAVERRRDDEHLIAEQYLRTADVVLGGGSKFFTASKRKDGKDLMAEFQRGGFAVARSKAELAQAGPASKMLGLFSDSHVPYTVDQMNDAKLQSTVPTLAEMTAAALASLSAGRNGFLLQVEGARVDHAAHNNDAAALLWDQLAFDDAIETAVQFAGKHPETLVVITSDHGNSNPGLNGMGTEYAESDACFERIAKIRQSFELLNPKLGASGAYTMKEGAGGGVKAMPSVEHVQALAKEALGFTFTPEEADAVRRSVGGVRKLSLNRLLDKPVGILGQAVGNHIGVGWTGTQHTSDYVLISALGPGSERFNGHVRNTEAFATLTGFMGSAFRNPAMEPEKAKQFKAVAMIQRDRPDWA